MDEKIYYQPPEKDRKIIERVYNEFAYMRDIRSNRYNYFNDRTLKQFIDDSELRATSYVPTRAEQNKEDWQANFFHPVTRNKMKAILAAVALDVPDYRITATNENNMKSQSRAEIAKNLIKSSYDRNTNKEEDIYFEGWECLCKGTVHVYEGFKKTKMKRKFINSYDPINGNVEYDEKDVVVDNDCVNFIIPLEQLFIWDYYIPNIQDQPRIMWATRMDRTKFYDEFGKYPNSKYVKDGRELIGKDLESRYFMEGWQTRVSKGKKPFEIIRYYDKTRDEYLIVANGVLLLNSPLLLGKRIKWYPIAKTIFEPFASDFYYGNSMPNSLMGEQDVINALYNTAIDRTYKSLMQPLLVGNVNKDDFDLEDGIITHDTKIYVQDINQVKPLDAPNLKAADIKMIDIVSRGLDVTSVDPNQQGIAGRGVTAREVVIANENAQKLRGAMYMFLSALWVQKIKLRLMNIITFYTKSKFEASKGNPSDDIFDKYRTILVENTTLSNGQKGTMGIHIANDQNKLPTPQDLTASEKNYKKANRGENYESIAMTSDYLDDWDMDIKVIPESIFQKESSSSVARMETKLKIMATIFPEYLALNKKKLFKQSLIAYDDDPDEYNLNPPQQAPATPSTGQPGQLGRSPQPGKKTATAGNLPFKYNESFNKVL